MKIERLDNYIKIISGFPFKSELFNEEGIGLPLIRVRDINSGFSGMYYSGKYQNEYVIYNGNILIGMDGDFNAVVWKHGTAVLNQRVCKLVVDEKKLNKFYLLQFLPKALKNIHGKTTFTTVKHLSTKSIEAIQIPLPENYDDQIRITAVLTRAEALITKRKESIKALDELLKSTFLEMFGDPVKNEKGFQISPLSDFIIHMTSGGRGWSKYYSNDGDRFIRSLDVQMNRISKEDVVYVIPPKGKESDRTRVRVGDVLLTITGSCIGRVAYVPANFGVAYVSQHVAIIRTQGINSTYLSFFLSMPNAGQLFISKQQYGQTKPGLNLKQIESFPILKAPRILQDKFSSIVEKVESLKARYTQSLTELENLYGSLSQKAFKGKLDLSGVQVEKEEKL